jgi:hypothetical protein
VSLEDKLAIQEVMAQQAYPYDAQDTEGFAALFMALGPLGQRERRMAHSSCTERRH